MLYSLILVKCTLILSYKNNIFVHKKVRNETKYYFTKTLIETNLEKWIIPKICDIR